MSDDAFMRKRPAKGQAFLCANDAVVLLDLYIQGQTTHTSKTSTRSLEILYQGGLINADLTLTVAGREVIQYILTAPCPKQ